MRIPIKAVPRLRRFNADARRRLATPSLFAVTAALIFLIHPGNAASSAEDRRAPNFVVIFTDDK